MGKVRHLVWNQKYVISPIWALFSSYWKQAWANECLLHTLPVSIEGNMDRKKLVSPDQLLHAKLCFVFVSDMPAVYDFWLFQQL